MSQSGKWVPVSNNEVGADVYEKLNLTPQEAVLGDDGFMYCMVQRPVDNSIETIDLNTDDDVINLKPVIQPLVLVPYLSTNQPLYQFSPEETQKVASNPSMSLPQQTQQSYVQHVPQQGYEQQGWDEPQNSRFFEEDGYTSNAPHPTDYRSFKEQAFGITEGKKKRKK
jgi:hypothetical protein